MIIEAKDFATDKPNEFVGEISDLGNSVRFIPETLTLRRPGKPDVTLYKSETFYQGEGSDREVGGWWYAGSDYQNGTRINGIKLTLFND